MSQLTVYAEADSKNPLLATEDVDVICAELGSAGIQLERWKAGRDLADDADNETIIAAYRSKTAAAHVCRCCYQPAILGRGRF